jgi:ribonuclease G
MREIIINILDEEKRIAFLEDEKLDEFYIEREEGEQFVGNIYKGRIVNIKNAIQAAFVDIGLDKNGFLHVSDVEPDVALFKEMEGEEDNIETSNELPPQTALPKQVSISSLLKENQEVLVQVMKGPIGTKGVRLTTNISIPGRHIVLLPNTKLRGVSRKIAEREERMRLKKMLNELRLPPDTGIIVRTVAGGISQKDMYREFRHLLWMWKRIQRRIKITKTPGCVHSELDLVLRTVRDSLTEYVTRVVIDSKREFKRVRKFISIFLPKFKTRVELYDEVTPIFEKYGIEKDIQKIFSRKVWLKSGGYLVIDQTEALISIDINSGKYVNTKDMEETALMTNLEAAKEIGRQLRLRNVGGIVIIDFIDMESGIHQKLVMKELKESLSKDKAKINIYPFSKLGVVELTRQRIKESIAREVFQSCPYCHGDGRVKSVETIMIEIKRKLQQWLQNTKSKSVTITTHDDVYIYIKEMNFPEKWRKALGVNIIINPDKSLHLEEYRIA